MRWICTFLFLVVSGPVTAQELTFPPRLPDGKDRVVVQSPQLLEPPANAGDLQLNRDDVLVAKAVPKVELLYYPGQDYEGHPWSVWGDGTAVDDKYYSAIGDHLAPQGNAFVYEYDATSGDLRLLTDVKRVLKKPEGHYSPGKIHTKVDLGKDGWLYFATHRGSTRVTTDEYHFKGDWILRHHPKTGKTEVVAAAPLEKQGLPTGILDAERMLFYAGTADGDRQKKEVMFLAYDVPGRRVLHSNSDGPRRCMILAQSSGKVYYVPKSQETGEPSGDPLVCFDPQNPDRVRPIGARIGMRAASQETSDGFVYTVDRNGLWEFNTRTEEARFLGPAAVGKQTYTTTIDLDPRTERYLYYLAGAHGGSQNDGAPLVQYDRKSGKRKVIAFLHPALYDACGYIPLGTFGLAVSPAGDKVFITWNGNRGTDLNHPPRRVDFNTCALTVVHIPASERRP